MAQELYSKEAVYDKLILALLDEFDQIRTELKTLGEKYTKYKPRLYTSLFRCAEALRNLLKASPDTGEVEDWINIITQNLPERHAKKLLKKWRITKG